MEGYQFTHIEVYAAKPSKSKASESETKRKNGQRAWSAAEILDENERKELASEHVIANRPAPEIIPGAYSTFSEFRDAHAKAAAVKESFPYTMNGKTTTRRRKVRSDSPTMYTCVVSLPVLTADALEDPELKKRCMNILKQAFEFERKRIEKCGGQVGMAVVHWDEERVHMHILALDPKRGRVDHLHPGRTAKKARVEELQGSGESKKEINRAGDRAYCDAMRAYQNDFHNAVFSKAGLLRFGPRRERLSTSEYKRKKAAARETAALQEKHADLSGSVGDMQLEMVMSAHERTRVEHQALVVQEERLALESGKVELAGKSDALAAREAQLRIEKRAMVRGRHALEREEVVYRPADEDKPERLTTGPNAPQDARARRKLAEVIQPAARWLLGLARSFWRAKKRERQAERELAEAHRAAALVVEQQQAAGLVVSRSLAEISAGIVPGSYSVDAFPEALAVAADEDPTRLQRRLDDMTNATVVRRYDATTDAALLTEDQPELTEQFETGRRVLSLTARQRGLDLQTGMHDPATAEDALRARLHVDTPPHPIRVRRVERAPQRVR